MDSNVYTRFVALDDIAVSRSDNTGRTVDAYATVFDTPTEIKDRDGHYQEQISRAAFAKTVAEKGTGFGVFYNHGKTLYGTPSERFSLPLGTPLEVKPDGKGLFTRTRYNKSALSDEVLDMIANGDIKGQSFTGRMVKSDKKGPYRARNGELTLVTRSEIALMEYGPTPFPAYETAEITGVRSVIMRLHELGGLDLDDDKLLALIESARSDTRISEPSDAQPAPEGAATGEPSDTAHSGPVMRSQSVYAILMEKGLI